MFIVLMSLALSGQGEQHPSVKTLLETTAEPDFKREAPFFTALISLIRDQGLELEDSLVGSPLFVSGNAFAVGRYVVVVLRGSDLGMPGGRMVELVLIDRDGTILDTLACEVSSRFGEPDAGLVQDAEGRDRVVIRLKPRCLVAPDEGEEFRFYSHEVAHEGTIYRFEDHLFPWVVWQEMGLCRVAIKDDRFLIVFPLLGDAAFAWPADQPGPSVEESIRTIFGRYEGRGARGGDADREP